MSLSRKQAEQRSLVLPGYRIVAAGVQGPWVEALGVTYPSQEGKREGGKREGRREGDRERERERTQVEAANRGLGRV